MNLKFNTEHTDYICIIGLRGLMKYFEVKMCIEKIIKDSTLGVLDGQMVSSTDLGFRYYILLDTLNGVFRLKETLQLIRKEIPGVRECKASFQREIVKVIVEEQ